MIKNTQAAVLFETSKPLRLCTLALPDLKPGQVLVKIAYSGVCHSQLNEMRGLKGPDKNLPHTLGHEASGVVEDIGPGVTKVKIADSVVLSWIKGKGMEASSTVYQSNGREINSGAISTFMNYAVVSENRVVPISRMVPFREAVLLGCAIPTGAGIIFNTAKVQSESSVAIFGVGGIGLSAILAAKIAGASTIIAIDVVEQKLELAKKVGATHAIFAAPQKLEVDVMQITKGKGVDYAIEASGKREAMETAFKIVKDQGGLCVLAGNLPHQEKISIDPFDLIKGKRIIGTWGGETQPDYDIPLYVDLYLKGKLKLDDLITHEYRLEQINEAFTDLEKGKVGRALIRMDESQ